MKRYITPKMIGLLALSLFVGSSCNADAILFGNKNKQSSASGKKVDIKTKGKRWVAKKFHITRDTLGDEAVAESVIKKVMAKDYISNAGKYMIHSALELTFDADDSGIRNMPPKLAVLNAADGQQFYQGGFDACSFEGTRVIILDKSCKLETPNGEIAVVENCETLLDDINNIAKAQFTGSNYRGVRNAAHLQQLVRSNFGNSLLFLKSQANVDDINNARQAIEDLVKSGSVTVFDPRIGAVKYGDYSKNVKKYENDKRITIELERKSSIKTSLPASTSILIVGDGCTFKAGDLDSCIDLSLVYFEKGFNINYSVGEVKQKKNKTLTVKDISVLLNDFINGTYTHTNYDYKPGVKAADANLENDVLPGLEAVFTAIKGADKQNASEFLRVLPQAVVSDQAATTVNEIARLTERAFILAQGLKSIIVSDATTKK